MAIFRRKRTPQNKRAIAELLEPRVMYSADTLGPLASLLPDVTDEPELELPLPENWPSDTADQSRQITTESEIESTTFEDEELRLEGRNGSSVATIVVSNQSDSVDPDLNATVDSLGPDPTLREAIIAAMNTPGNVTIELSSTGTYSLTRGGEDDAARVGDIDISMVDPTDELIINNTSGSSVVIEQTSTARIFEIFEGELRLNDVMLLSLIHI